LLAGLGFCALLPPFEGFDETAHYSYIQQIAQTGSRPQLNDPMAADVDDYFKAVPTPMKAPWSYWAFFRAPAETVQAGAAAIHGARDPLRRWRPGTSNNWEGQHPPLYYALLSPIWLLSKSWSIYAQLFLLRAVSYLFAWGGLVIVTVTLARRSAASSATPLLVVGPALWPALFPMWFPEMARLGNDSLVLLLLALAWVVTRRAIGPRGQTLQFALLGGLCGLALLTKATALPFVAALGLFLTWRVWRSRRNAAMRRIEISQLLVFCLVLAAIAGWWHLKNFIDYGSPILSADSIALAKQGGMLKGLSENFSLPMSIRGLASIVRSFAWTGTWSFVSLPRVTEVPLSILVAVVAAGWIWQVSKARTISDIDAISVLTLALFGIALLHHMLVFIALFGAYTPGDWYLHSLAPLLAPLLARGLAEAARWRRARPAIGALVSYPLLFLATVTAFHLFYFAGCLSEAVSGRRYELTEITACAGSPHELLSHLAVLGNPAFAIPLFGVGWAVILTGILIVIARWFFCAERPQLLHGRGP
jgi:hypothetical protein